MSKSKILSAVHAVTPAELDNPYARAHIETTQQQALHDVAEEKGLRIARMHGQWEYHVTATADPPDAS